MVRDTEEGKTDFTYVLPGPMLERWAIHLMKGAVKYDKNNWLKAKTQAALDRYERSALRHIRQWITGENTWEYDEDLDEWVEIIEDHAAAVLFNINGAEYVRAILEAAAKAEDKGPGNVLAGGLLGQTLDAYLKDEFPSIDFDKPQLYNFTPDPEPFSAEWVKEWLEEMPLQTDGAVAKWNEIYVDDLYNEYGRRSHAWNAFEARMRREAAEELTANQKRHQELAADFSAYVKEYWNTEETVATTTTELTEAKLREAYEKLVKASEVYNARIVEEAMPKPVYRAPLDATEPPPIVPGYAEGNDCGDPECGCGPR